MTEELPKHVVLTTKFSTGITAVVSITYLILSIFALIFYFDCGSGNADASSDRFWAYVYKVYLQNSDCSKNIATIENLTPPYTIFVLTAITLSFSFVNVFTSATLFFQIDNGRQSQMLNICVYAYIGAWLSMLVVDLTLGSHFGVDITNLSKLLDTTPLYDPNIDLLRQGAFYLMTIALKGYVIYVINIILITLMIIYFYELRNGSRKDVNSVFMSGPINAFEYVNNTYLMDEDPRVDNANSMQDDFTNNRMNNAYRAQPSSWNQKDQRMFGKPNNQREPMYQNTQPNYQRDQPNYQRDQPNYQRDQPNYQRDQPNYQRDQPNYQSPQVGSQRPFSYLEDIRGQNASTNAAPATWHTPWVPAVPAPDYSPSTPRRLKPAIKQNYS